MRLLYIVLILLGLMSIITFFFYLADKQKAKKGAWRVRESTLLLLSFLGGSIGAMLGMFLLRHKTQHAKFLILVPLSLLLHVALVVFMLVKGF